MAGVRQFNTERVLDQVMRVFWRLGYEATSVQDLTDATGLGRGSLYGAFGSKEGLFLAVLEHYLGRSRQPWLDALDRPDLGAALRGAFGAILDVLTAGDAPPGCLLVVAAQDSEERAQRVRRRVVRAYADEERAFYDRLRRAQADGQLEAGADLRALARFLSAQTRAIGVTARLTSDPDVLRDIAELALDAVPLVGRRAAA